VRPLAQALVAAFRRSRQVLRYDGRVAVITGAGRGLGRAHALLLAERGASVVVNDVGAELDGSSPSEQPARAVAAEITKAGGIAVADTSSVSTAEGAGAIVAGALREFGRIDIVVNNAGTTGRAAFGELDEDRLSATLASHLLGAFNVSRAAWTPMTRQGYGRIVNTTSAVGFFGMGQATAYAAAKMGIFGLTRSLAIEGEEHGVLVNALAPIAETRMARGVYGPLAPKLTPELVSAVLALLAHEECPVTGRVLSAGGGRVAELFVGATQGYFDPDLTPEAVSEHLAEALDRRGYAVPEDAMAEVGLTAASYGLATSSSG
jgi:NAD(P)-dependent dehydrogenase (short-subunit alcohol dehydrogenase family)